MKNIKEQVLPPIAKKQIHKTQIHNLTLEDPYHWLKEKSSDEVLDYLRQENDYTHAKMQHTQDLQAQLFNEMLGRIKETDLSVPIKDGDYYYYSRQEEGKSYSIHCRKKGSLEAPEEILLDENILAEDLESFSLGDFEVSDDHQLLAYSVDKNGSEKYTIFIKDLTTNQLLSDQILETDGNIIWANDNQTFFYTRMDETMRPFQLFRHTIGQDTANDVLVYQEADASFYLGAYKTKSNQYIVLHIGSKVTSEVHYLNANQIEDPPTLLARRQYKVEYSIDHHGDHFYILTNENALNFKLLKAPVHQTDKANWKEVFPYDEAVKLDGIELFKEYLVVYGRKNGLKHITTMHLPTNTIQDVQFPEEVYTYWDDDNPEFESHKIRLIYSSLVTPRTVYDYNLQTQEFEFLKEYEVLGGYDRTQYTMERAFATAEDGTKIPMSILYKKGLEKNGENPCYMFAYGSYGMSMDPYFSSTRFSLIDRGFIYAIPHLRGGGEMGRSWYENGKFLNKKNTFNDLIACAEHLVQEKFTHPEKLVAVGGSAGGLLIGATANLRPDLFKAMVAHVPFVDVINTMLDKNLPLTIIEYDEWGNPNEKTYFDYMLSYSPYDNVTAKDYPHLLVTAGLNDPRVQYWEPAKWTAKLRDLKTDAHWLLLKTNMESGHGGKSGRYGYLEELAFEFAFVLDRLKISN